MRLTPSALLRGYAFVGVDPKQFGISPVKAIPAALGKARLNLGDIDLIELNEAFAAQYLSCEQELGLDRTRVNVNGGAIALGHPVAATGTRLLTTLLYAMRQRDVSLGLVSLCIGGRKRCGCRGGTIELIPGIMLRRGPCQRKQFL